MYKGLTINVSATRLQQQLPQPWCIYKTRACLNIISISALGKHKGKAYSSTVQSCCPISWLFWFRLFYSLGHFSISHGALCWKLVLGLVSSRIIPHCPHSLHLHHKLRKEKNRKEKKSKEQNWAEGAKKRQGKGRKSCLFFLLQTWSKHQAINYTTPELLLFTTCMNCQQEASQSCNANGAQLRLLHCTCWSVCTAHHSLSQWQTTSMSFCVLQNVPHCECPDRKQPWHGRLTGAPL